MAVATADGEPNCALPEATRLAVNANEVPVVVDDEVAAGVLAKRDIERYTAHSEARS
jgi:hypothetical protein